MKKTIKIISLTVVCVLLTCLFSITSLAEDNLTDDMKGYMKLVYDTTNQVLADGKGTYNYSRFGAVDSESSFSKNSTIAPVVAPLIEDKMPSNEYIWLAYGDKKGAVIDVYMSYSIDKTEVLKDDVTIPCVKYDGATDEYTKGTITVKFKTLAGPEGTDKYFVLLRDTFKPLESGTGTGGSTTTTPGEVNEDDDDKGSGDNVTLSVLTPKKMSVRLENGTILNNGDSFTLNVGDTVSFQMCSNNWDNNIYDDDGNGIAGTVVYTVRVSDKFNERSYDPASHSFVIPRGDLVLRTDVNKCFMAYKYHFRNGDYNKQTGIADVVNTPLESLSVNLPLGSTITSDAYKAMEKIDSANVFIENDDDPEISYTDYYWEH